MEEVCPRTAKRILVCAEQYSPNTVYGHLHTSTLRFTNKLSWLCPFCPFSWVDRIGSCLLSLSALSQGFTEPWIIILFSYYNYINRCCSEGLIPDWLWIVVVIVQINAAPTQSHDVCWLLKLDGSLLHSWKKVVCIVVATPPFCYSQLKTTCHLGPCCTGHVVVFADGITDIQSSVMMWVWE